MSDDKVISIDSARKSAEDDKPGTPHVSGKAQCLGCDHRWVAVAPVGTFGLECPACHTEKGVWTWGFHETGYHWVCGCGSTIFNCTPNGALCCGCGLRHDYKDM